MIVHFSLLTEKDDSSLFLFIPIRSFEGAEVT